MLNDIEFIGGFSAEIVDDYTKAKSYVRDIPTQALVFVRSFTHQVTSLLAEKQSVKFNSPNLYDRIEQLNRMRFIDVPTTRALHRLRSDGNRGAHPEKYHLTQDQLVSLAEKTIKNILSLITLLYPKIHRKKAPEYQFEAFDSFVGRELCYQAVMHNDHQAQYLVGMSLKSKALMQQEQEQSLDQEAAEHAESVSTFKQAANWFELASDKHQQALFEHGVALLHGYNGSKNAVAGELAIERAAKEGVVEAKALLGFFYLVGSENFSVDLTVAATWLEKAALAENTEAMSNLGVLYYQQQQLDKAFEWINKAAQAGYPHAQYHLALMLFNGEGCEANANTSEHWLAEAAEQGQLDAMFTRAQHMLNDDSGLGADVCLAERYLRDVINYGRSVPAMIELSVALADGVFKRIDVVESASLLKLAKQYANDEQAEIIEPIWQSLQIQIDNVIALKPSDEELKSLVHAQGILA
ncbi:tetratricopeptide repeat protein [uncultured Shewanella sp.]|uniref:tetratricopeptide repeat protein n=1 Tax=uncultured Shewanella sp. TaxID=173975 RepID=UPI0026197C87|nr:tetratricopeptide repeat protein [uncultured Shewanella sp.]